MTLYVALEDNNLDLIQSALESLRKHVEPMDNAELSRQVDKALEQVSLGDPPTQDVFNIITVSLPMAWLLFNYGNLMTKWPNCNLLVIL